MLACSEGRARRVSTRNRERTVLGRVGRGRPRTKDQEDARTKTLKPASQVNWTARQSTAERLNEESLSGLGRRAGEIEKGKGWKAGKRRFGSGEMQAREALSAVRTQAWVGVWVGTWGARGARKLRSSPDEGGELGA